MISEEYRKQQEKLHEREDYGSGHADIWGFLPPILNDVIRKFDIQSLTDYGCGKCHLFSVIESDHKIKLQAYDPGIERYSADPVPTEMVCCIDVLEHIEPEHLDSVLDKLAELTQKVAILSVHCGPAAKTLDDGRNAHLIQKPLEWWLPRIWERFHVKVMQDFGPGFFVIVVPRPGMDI